MSLIKSKLDRDITLNLIFKIYKKKQFFYYIEINFITFSIQNRRELTSSNFNKQLLREFHFSKNFVKKKRFQSSLIFLSYVIVSKTKTKLIRINSNDIRFKFSFDIYFQYLNLLFDIFFIQIRRLKIARSTNKITISSFFLILLFTLINFFSRIILCKRQI